MNCPRCSTPTEEGTLREFGGVCPKCLLQFSEEKDAPAFPNLEIVELLGQGGMGVVYKARQKNLDRIVALKVLSPHLSQDAEFVERFTREAKALAQLSHPHIVNIFDSGIYDHVPYLVMEFVDGTPLRSLLASRQLAPERVLEVIPQICDALNYAHAKGVVHRDIKPENILVDRGGRVKIADFGLAKLASLEENRLTKTGFVMGSPHYMAPEQLQNSGQVDHRADIYSLGVVFYEMLTGELPLGRFKPPSEKSAADRRLDPVVLKSLEREPADRWQSAEELKSRVLRLEEGARDAVKAGKKMEIGVGLSSALIGISVATALHKILHLEAILIGPLTIALMGVCLLVGLGVLYQGRPIDEDTLRRIRRQLVGVSVSTGIMILVSLVLLLLVQRNPAPLPPAATRLLPRAAEPAPVPPEPSARPSALESPPHSVASVRDWTVKQPLIGRGTGLFSTDHLVVAECPTELIGLDPSTGEVKSRTRSTIEGYVAGENWIVIWGDARIRRFLSAPSGLLERESLAIPFPAHVAGATIDAGMLYLHSYDGHLAAVDLERGQVFWKSDPFPEGTVGGAPVPLPLEILTFDEKAVQLRDRLSGLSKYRLKGKLPSGRVLQWPEGLIVLRQDKDELLAEAFYKINLAKWTEVHPSSEPSLYDCHLALTRSMVVLTTVNQIFGIPREERHPAVWSGITIPNTAGPLAAVDDSRVAVPTVQGVFLFNLRAGRCDSASFAGSGEFSLVACWKDRLVCYDAEKRELAGFRIPSPSSLREPDEWPEPYRLPAGFRVDAKASQEEAFLLADLPKDLRNAVNIIRYERVSPGSAVVLYLRFHSAGARRQWLDKPDLKESQDGWIRRVLSGEEGLWLLHRGTLSPDSPALHALIDGMGAPQPRDQ